MIKFYNVTKGPSESSYRKRAPAVLLLLISIDLEVQRRARELYKSGCAAQKLKPSPVLYAFAPDSDIVRYNRT